MKKKVWIYFTFVSYSRIFTRLFSIVLHIVFAKLKEVKTAFNLADWKLIRNPLARTGVPNYIVIVDGGVLQGSLLWNIMYNDVLNLTVPDWVAVAERPEDAVLYSREAIRLS